jgi:hypothetical protein
VTRKFGVFTLDFSPLQEYMSSFHIVEGFSECKVYIMGYYMCMECFFEHFIGLAGLPEIYYQHNFPLFDDYRMLMC